MVVRYIDNGKRALFGDLIYTRDDTTGYYLNSTLGIRLHRAVYLCYNGEIPEGFHVHHVDHDKNNNEPENLVALSKEDHLRLHGLELSEDEREARRDNLTQNARPAASEWHKSDEGRAWHLEHYEQMKDALYVRILMTCDNCGKTFEGIPNQSRFCSNACKSAWRRKAGLDDVDRECPSCGRIFRTNKYAPAECCSRSCANRWRFVCKNQENSQASC